MVTSNREMEARFTMRIEMPMVPNFLHLTGERGGSVDVGAFDDALLEAVGREWTKALLANARKRRART